MSDHTLTVDSLANAIRTVDGNHDLGAGVLAEMLVSGWLADHDRQVRAEALRSAARDFAEGEWAEAFLTGCVSDDESAVRAVDNWLTDRADGIEAGS